MLDAASQARRAYRSSGDVHSSLSCLRTRAACWPSDSTAGGSSPSSRSARRSSLVNTVPRLSSGIQIVGAEPASAAERSGRVRESGCPGSETSRTPPAQAPSASASEADESDLLYLVLPPLLPPSSERPPLRAAAAAEGPIGGLEGVAASGAARVVGMAAVGPRALSSSREREEVEIDSEAAAAAAAACVDDSSKRVRVLCWEGRGREREKGEGIRVRGALSIVNA